MAGWASLRELVKEEWVQLEQEGRDLSQAGELRREFDECGDDETRLARLHSQMLELPMRKDFGFEEPNDLDSIRKLRPHGPRRNWSGELPEAELEDKMLGAWLGRCVGCALGKPVEAYMGPRNGLASWERQKVYLQAVSEEEWPVRDYFPMTSPAEDECGKIWGRASVRERIAFMESDDDIRYTVLGQILVREFGPGFTSALVAWNWLDKLTYNQVCTAETQAYRNFAWYVPKLRHSPALTAPEIDDEIDWEFLATHQNPYREWIGAQIRVDSYAYSAAGNPELAAELAYRDARISHVKNGIYGAMFCAAMIAASFVLKNPREIVLAGLAEIPATCRLSKEMHQVLDICAKYEDDPARFEDVFRDIYALLGHYNPVHTNNNSALCVAALVLGGGDFHRGITIAVMGGWDTDCNGATVGSMVGAMTGGANCPPHWTARLNDTLNSNVVEYHPIAITECARRSAEIALNILHSASPARAQVNG